MKSAEETIEKVLAGLRDAAAPDGMEQRVLDSLERRELVQSARDGWRPGWLSGRIRLVQVSCFVAAGTIFLVFVLWGMGRRSSVQRMGFVPSVKDGQTGLVDRERTGSLGSAPVGASLRDVNANRVRRAPARKIEREGSSESVEWSEMHAPSHPAPEVPLTEEERQLLRVVHKSDRVELAELKSSARDERNAREKAEFQEFFEQVKNGGSE